jgi:phosphoenolpyruvate synthase/pyruvate phosphate dikinase
MEKYVLGFNEVDKTSLPYVGGKGANLGEMLKAGFPVPQGFCVTTRAYQAFVQQSTEFGSLLDQLEHINPNDLEHIRKLGLGISDRRFISGTIEQKITKKQIAKKKIAIYSLPEGGTITKEIPPENQEMQALEDAKIIELAEWGRKIEEHYGCEQDIEWGYARG